jgi:dCTP deaminase
MDPEALFPDLALVPSTIRDEGALPSQHVRRLVEAGVVSASVPVEPGQVQPASLDLRVGRRAFRVPASFLPSQCPVARKLDELKMYELDLTRGAVLETGCVYIVEILERLSLPKTYRAVATPKSTTGRLDVFARLITDYAAEFETVRKGYEGPLYLEVCPQSFSILVTTGVRLNQIRFRRGDPEISDKGLVQAHKDRGLVGTAASAPEFRGGLRFSVDLAGKSPGAPVAYRARPHTRQAIDLLQVGRYDPGEFWDVVHGPVAGGLILYPGDFYILATVESVRVPPELSAEMVAHDSNIGEFRVHYAGFFDPGFGYDAANPAAGTPAVLEVRAHQTPFLLDHGQKVGRLEYEVLLETPEQTYGSGIGSNYAKQGLTLAKQFRR